MKKISKSVSIIIILAIFLILTHSMEVQATLQANQNTQYKKLDGPENWMRNFRQMETAGSAMGLNETLNSDLTASSDSNNIDVHMMRTTEYGAIAILSASGYGNPSNNKAITSTTGNNTGVILNTANWEWTAGGLNGSIFSGTDSRYYDTYTLSNASARVGDALGTSATTNPGSAGWHTASESSWIRGTSTPYFIRGGGGIFSFNYVHFGGNFADGTPFYCHGVVVCGNGL